MRNRIYHPRGEDGWALREHFFGKDAISLMNSDFIKKWMNWNAGIDPYDQPSLIEEFTNEKEFKKNGGVKIVLYEDFSFKCLGLGMR